MASRECNPARQAVSGRPGYPALCPGSAARPGPLLASCGPVPVAAARSSLPDRQGDPLAGPGDGAAGPMSRLPLLVPRITGAGVSSLCGQPESVYSFADDRKCFEPIMSDEKYTSYKAQCDLKKASRSASFRSHPCQFTPASTSLNCTHRECRRFLRRVSTIKFHSASQ